MTNHAAQLAIIKHVTRQESRSSAGNCQASLESKYNLHGSKSLGWEDPVEKEMATHSSVLALEIPWAEEPGGL